MITDDSLERLFAVAGDSYEIPAGAVDAILLEVRGAVATDHPQVRRLTRRSTILLAAAAAIVLVAVAAFAGSGFASKKSNLRTDAVNGLGVSGQGPVAAPDAGLARTGSQLHSSSGVAGSGSTSGGGSAGGFAEAGTGAVSAPAPPTRAVAGQGSAPARPGLTDGARIVQTASITLEVRKDAVKGALDRLQVVAAVEGGYVSSTKTATGGADPTGVVTIRVPVARYGEAVTKASALGTVIDSTTSGTDVTAQYTDLNARLHALEASRSTYLTLLTRAGTIGDVLSVQQRIDDVQQQIEQLQGQIKSLADRSELATITVSIAEKGAAVATVPKPRSGISKAFHDAGHGFTRGVERIIAGSGTAALVLVCLVVLFFAGRLAWRVTQRRLI